MTYGAVGALGDQPLPALAAGLDEELLAVAVAVLRPAHVAMEFERVAEQPLARSQRELAHVVTFEPQDVEHVVEDRDVVLAPLCELGEARLRPVERDHLTVDREAIALLLFERLDELGPAVVLGQVVAREELDGGAGADRDTPDPVELALEDPVRIGEPLVGQHRLHRAGGGRRRRLRCQLSLVGAEGVDHAHLGSGVAIVRDRTV